MNLLKAAFFKQTKINKKRKNRKERKKENYSHNLKLSSTLLTKINIWFQIIFYSQHNINVD